MNEIIEEKRDIYQSKYKIVPQFKAGIHAGKVIVTEIGKLKKEIVYHGDVLNTTSRIEKKCNELNEQLLISEDALAFVKPINEFRIEEKGKVSLKGKTHNIRIFSVNQVKAN